MEMQGPILILIITWEFFWESTGNLHLGFPGWTLPRTTPCALGQAGNRGCSLEYPSVLGEWLIPSAQGAFACLQTEFFPGCDLQIPGHSGPGLTDLFGSHLI